MDKIGTILMFVILICRNGRRFMKRILSITLLVAVLGLVPTGSTRAADLPPEAFVDGFIGHPQSYNLSCESRSASDWAAFFGVDADETDILTRLGSSDNPELGFVGSWNGVWGAIPPNSYGVHAPAIARVLREYGLPAQEKKGLTWDEARAELAAGEPVIVWIIGGVWPGTPVQYTADDGQTMTVAAYEHTMTLVGYTENLVYLVDSASALTYTPSLDAFLVSWGVLENQAVVYSGEAAPVAAPPSTAPAAPQEPAPEQPVQEGDLYTVKRGEFLIGLAFDFGISWEELAAANNLSYPYTLYPGQELVIPRIVAEAPEATPQPTPTPAVEQITPAVESAPNQHIVRNGDHLMALGRQYGTTWQAIVELNELDYPYFIYPGQVLLLPADAQKPGAEEVSTPTSQEAPEPIPSETEAAPVAVEETYVVQPGDFLRGLAGRFEVSWESIADANHLDWPYVIHPGDSLVIPAD
jgi:LysM repeat protein/uncharacterized protein YvpB